MVPRIRRGSSELAPRHNTSRELAPRPNTTALIKSESHALRTLLRVLQAPHIYFNMSLGYTRTSSRLASFLFYDPSFQLPGGHAISPPGLTRPSLQHLSSAPSGTCCRHCKMAVFSSDRRREDKKTPLPALSGLPSVSGYVDPMVVTRSRPLTQPDYPS